eukprot:CAMPEP_0117031564 /NCGR_PEP_ID=MMETSP0472-20121206/22672_1 /TAXON_ID=693140 ORGANISM="Tiarina fusus, Strain LIS" /NCGR_SAMPLE_ID=MMETSP0472 /ASSEMBLY_ACC=CAM_ASM_000603 /LENGTH=209 /DNA_ID=CAMNT_0004739915 /DNA_START=47 /DNA_END=676 /DNA_ORIENTATION=-
MAEGAPIYKILVVGDPGTGKTSIVHRYVNDEFSSHYKATIGVDFAIKVLNWQDKSQINIQLWDIGGQQRFNHMTRVYYKEAVGAFIVFDINRVDTFDAVRKWKSDMDSKVSTTNSKPIHVVLLANKYDMLLQNSMFNQQRSQMDQFCEENGIEGWFETSAALGYGIEEAANCLLGKVLENAAPPVEEGPTGIKVNNTRKKQPDNGGCCS